MVNEMMNDEVTRSELIIYRLRYVAVAALAIATPFVTHAAKMVAMAERTNPDVIGGEYLIPVFMLMLVALIYPKYKLVPIEEEVEATRFNSSHVDIDLNEEECYQRSYYSESGVFDVIDKEGNHHIIRFEER